MLKKIISIALSLVLMFSVATVCFISANAEESNTPELGNKYEISTGSGGSLILRSDASDKGVLIARIPDESVILITEIKNGYGKAVFGNLQGWVSMDYLHPTDKELTEASHLTELSAYFIVTLDGDESLELYSKGNDEGSVIGYIPNGAEIYICELSGNGERGNTVYNNQYGWVQMDKLTHVSGNDLFIDTDESWVSEIDEAGNLIIPHGGTVMCWRYNIEKYSLKYYIDEEDNLIIPAEEALRYWSGDATLDGTLDMLDVTATQKHIAQLDTECNTLLADMDKNGDVNLEDVTAMQKEIAKL